MLEQKTVKKPIKIIFKFKSYNNYNLDFISPKILKKIKTFSITTTGFISLPKKIQRFTVLRSPHVDKKSREQFEIKTYSKVLVTFFDFENLYDKQKAKLLINYIKNSCGGVSLKITYTV